MSSKSENDSICTDPSVIEELEKEEQEEKDQSENSLSQDQEPSLPSSNKQEELKIELQQKKHSKGSSMRASRTFKKKPKLSIS